jgi:CheY-like chemotaxis protein
MSTKVLIIDDDLTSAHALERLLTVRGYDVQVEDDSTKALATARAFEPHVVVLDYMMPVMHGGDVAWQLASDEKLRGSKIVMWSGAPPTEIRRALPPRAIAICGKQLETEALLKVLRTD